MPVENKRIVKEYLVLCEGKDTMLFMIWYLNSEALSFDKRFSEEIQLLDFGGVSDLSQYLANLKNMEGYESVNRIMVIRDTELSIQSAIDEVKKAFRESGLSVPAKCNEWGSDKGNPYTAFTLMPTLSNEMREGTLEDLCWMILSPEFEEGLRTDVKNFVAEMKEKYHRIKAHEHKSKIHALFSVDDELVSLKIGEAAHAGAFDWSSKYLDPLKELLMEGLEFEKIKKSMA